MKIAKIIFYVLVVVLMLVAWGWLVSGEKDSPMEAMGAYTGLIMSGVLIAICALVWIGAAVFKVIDSPKDSMKSLIGIGVVVLIVLISWAVGSNEITDSYLKVKFDSPSASKWVSAGLNSMMVLGGLSIFAIIGSEVRSALLNRS